jgi:hypothetical protein
MIERGKQFGFALEARNAVRIPRELLRQDFDCNIAVEFPIPGLVNLAHASFAELTGNLVMAQRLADHEEVSSTSTAGSVQ